MAYIKSVSVRYHNKQDVINLVAYIGDVMKCDSMMAGRKWSNRLPEHME